MLVPYFGLLVWRVLLDCETGESSIYLSRESWAENEVDAAIE
jgi:hypothetical protein